MTILNPITDEAVLALDPALEGEHRLQSLLRLWYGKYFTGTPFSTHGVETTEQKTFMAAHFLWQDDVMPENPQKPVLHTVITADTGTRQDMRQGTFGHADRWLLELMVKIPANLTGTPHAGMDPDHVSRKFAGQVAWLFASSERAALSACGVMEVRIERDPVIIPGTTWNMRMAVASCLTTREQAR